MNKGQSRLKRTGTRPASPRSTAATDLNNLLRRCLRDRTHQPRPSESFQMLHQSGSNGKLLIFSEHSRVPAHPFVAPMNFGGANNTCGHLDTCAPVLASDRPSSVSD